MARTKEQTPEEEVNEVIDRFIHDETEMAETATRGDWLEFLSDKVGYELSFFPDAMKFWSNIAPEAQARVGVTVTKSPITRQVVFRIPKGLSGAGRFMSKETVAERVANWKTLLRMLP